MFLCAHDGEPELDSLEFPDGGVQLGEPWHPTAVCRTCHQRFELRPEQTFDPGGPGGLTYWYCAELIARANFELRSDFPEAA
jgi:hypothetical protein